MYKHYLDVTGVVIPYTVFITKTDDKYLAYSPETMVCVLRNTENKALLDIGSKICNFYQGLDISKMLIPFLELNNIEFKDGRIYY